MLQLHASLRMLSTRQIQTLLPTFCLPVPLGRALRLSSRQLSEAPPPRLSKRQRPELASQPCPRPESRCALRAASRGAQELKALRVAKLMAGAVYDLFPPNHCEQLSLGE